MKIKYYGGFNFATEMEAEEAVHSLINDGILQGDPLPAGEKIPSDVVAKRDIHRRWRIALVY